VIYLIGIITNAHICVGMPRNIPTGINFGKYKLGKIGTGETVIRSKKSYINPQYVIGF
jgi:hypothetical protein